MRGDLAKLTGLLHEVERERREHVGELSSQLREAGRHTQVLAETTQSLREALSSTTARGQWGERMAEDVLRLAGLDRRRQLPQAPGDPGFGWHPRLHVPAPAGPVPPHGREVPAEQLPALPRRRTPTSSASGSRKEFLQATCACGSRRSRPATTSTPSANTVDCVLLFIPNEQVYAFIQEQDRSILDDALRDKVIFCSPLTLFAVLAVIRQAVDNFRLSQTSQEILGMLQSFQKQWDTFVDQMDKVGRSLKTAGQRVRGARRHAPARARARARQDRCRPPPTVARRRRGAGHGDHTPLEA